MIDLRRALVSALALLLVSGSAWADDAALKTGIDLSHHNEVTDWSEIGKASPLFVILKATDGLGWLDPTFVDRFRSAGNEGVVRGAYHYYETDDDPAKQADWFIPNVTLKAGDLPPIVDIEHIAAPIDDDLLKDFDTFLGKLEAHYGHAPIIYTGPNFWDHAMKESLPGKRLWIADYNVDHPEIPDGWNDWTIWQYTDSFDLSGVNGEVDASYFNGSADDFQAVLIK